MNKDYKLLINTYLGSTLSTTVLIDDKVNASIVVKPVYHFADCVEMSGIEVESFWSCQPSYMHLRPGHSVSTPCQKQLPFKLSEKVPKGQMARQDPGDRNPERREGMQSTQSR